LETTKLLGILIFVIGFQLFLNGLYNSKSPQISAEKERVVSVPTEKITPGKEETLPELRPPQTATNFLSHWPDNLLVTVHVDNPVCEVSIEDIKNIWSGQMDNWKDCGGTSSPIKIIIAGSQWQRVRSIMPGIPNKNINRTKFNSVVVGTVGSNPDAVGIIGYDTNEQRDYLLSCKAIRVIPVSPFRTTANKTD
jgi:hypothetical protein